MQAMRRIIGMLVFALSLAACDTDDGSDGTAGDDAAASSSEEGQGSESAGACAPCASMLGPDGDLDALCVDNGPPSSRELHDALTVCTCGPTGACATECATSVCAEASPDAAPPDECFGCFQSKCADQLNACAADQ
jgi:hypothetical protein